MNNMVTKSLMKRKQIFDMKNGISLIKETTEIAISKNDSTITVLDLTLNNCGWFNYYGIEYSADCYIKATVHYSAGVKAKTEDFFLEP